MIDNKTRFEVAKPDILTALEQTGVKVFTASQLETIFETIFEENKKFWRLTESLHFSEFIKLLFENKLLEHVKLPFPNRTENRYAMGTYTIYDLLMSLPRKPYFSHYTAMFLHDLTEQVPKTIYVNCEQNKGPQKSELQQSAIEAAFKRKGRISNNFIKYKENQIYLLNGMNTGRLGVIEATGPDKERIEITNIERTLIDITVRPNYSGGVFEILKAYRTAKEKDAVSVNKLSAMLKKLNYTYPYHQAIGFYLEKAGVYDSEALDLMRKFDIQYDFYLSYGMTEMEYSKEWRLFFPKGF